MIFSVIFHPHWQAMLIITMFITIACHDISPSIRKSHFSVKLNNALFIRSITIIMRVKVMNTAA